MAGKIEDKTTNEFLAKPIVGSVFTLISGLAFMFMAMILPLVGPSGSTVAHAKKNFWTFLASLLFCLLMAILAVVSKLERRKVDQSPLPKMSIGMCLVCVFLLIALLSGALSL